MIALFLVSERAGGGGYSPAHGGRVMPFSRKKIKKEIISQNPIDNYAFSCYNVIRTHKGEILMNEIKIIQDIMENSTPKVTLDVLRDKMGYKTVSGVSERLRGKSMKVDTFVNFMDALGYEVIVQPKTARDPREGCYKVGDNE